MLVGAITRLFQKALQLEDGEIRCTSVTPFNLPSGANTDATLRKEIKQAKLMVGVLTQDSAESYYVLAELGARWGMDKALMVFRSPNFLFSSFSGPLANLTISPIDTHEIWFKHLDQAAKVFGRGRVTRTRAIRGLIDAAIQQNKLCSSRSDLGAKRLEIHSADYGWNGKNVDLLKDLQGRVVANSLQVAASNALGGDPCPGVPKELVVVYSYNGVKKTKRVKEDDTLILP